MDNLENPKDENNKESIKVVKKKHINYMHRKALSRRLVFLMQKNNLDSKKLSKKLNVSYESVRRYVRAEATPKDKVHKELAKILNVTQSFLKYGIDEEQIKADSLASLGTIEDYVDEESVNDYVLAPFLKDVQLSAGGGCVNDENYNSDKLKFSRAVLKKKGITPENVLCFSVRGNSMDPVLPSDTVVAINTNDTMIKDGDIYAFEQGDLLRVKLLYRLPNSLVKIKSYNDYEYPEEEIHMSKVNVIGRIFWWQVLI